MQPRISFTTLTCLLVLAIAIASVVALNTGLADIGVINGLQDFFNGEQSLAANVVGQIRLPRLILAIVIGATLGM